jgi:hypothetical protein
MQKLSGLMLIITISRKRYVWEMLCWKLNYDQKLTAGAEKRARRSIFQNDLSFIDLLRKEKKAP